MTWPVNWIEQASYYRELQSDLAQLQAQRKPIVLHSYREPSQSDWENAYVAQMNKVPPIVPGTRLFWYDMKNGTPKRYTTVWSSDNATIDATVRPFVSETEPRGCMRFLGTRQMESLSIFNPVLSPSRKPHKGIFIDLEMLIKKRLVSIMIHHKMFSPVLINLYEFNNTDNTFWGNTAKSFGVEWNRSSGGAVVNVSDFRAPGTAKLPQNTVYYPVSQFTDTTGAGAETVGGDVGHGMTIILGLGPDFSNEQQAFSISTNWMSQVGSLSGATYHTWLSYGMKYDGSGIRSLVYGRGTDATTSYNEHAYLYGIFADDPGPVEIFYA
jgi:hypothetical protein